MARITIIGSGIIGMSIAYVLANDHNITIVARDLPGDTPSFDWASPWAGASFVAGGCSSHRDAKMQIDAFKQLWEWSFAYPESSLVRVTMEEFFNEEKAREEFWWKEFMPEFHFLPLQRLPKGVKMGTSYRSLILNPAIFLPWLRARLEGVGVNFERKTVQSISEVHASGRADIIINATGLGAGFLSDVQDSDIHPVRGQTMLVRTVYDKAFIRDDSEGYTYVLPRMDGTAIVGGSRQIGSRDPQVQEEILHDIVRRVHANLPDHFPANLAEYDIVAYNVGLRPSRSTPRIEKEVCGDQKVVHAYGFSGGGYIYSFGAACLVRDHVDDLLSPPVAKL